MVIYKNTFENIKTLGNHFPVEDQFYAEGNLAIVADGITRDPVGISDLSNMTFEERIEKYPRPSGAELAAKTIVDCFKQFSGDLKQQLILANQKLKEINRIHVPVCDYLENDYYGAVASCAYKKNHTLYYSYICDCGVIVYNRDGNIKFQTEDDKKCDSDPFINKIGIPWTLPEARVIVRRDYRNNLNNIKDGKCVSYGAITGEESAVQFIKSGNIELTDGDVVIVYSDGFENFLHEEEFIDNILNFDKQKFENYVHDCSKVNYDKYGKEKTLVIMI